MYNVQVYGFNFLLNFMVGRWIWSDADMHVQFQNTFSHLHNTYFLYLTLFFTAVFASKSWCQSFTHL